MVNKIMNIIKRRFFYDPYKYIKSCHNVSLGKSILSKNFFIRFDRGIKDNSVTIGDNSILMNEIIFETNTGSISIGDGSFINGGTRLISIDHISIGNNVTIAWGCTIYDHDSHSLDYRERMLDQERQLADWDSGNFIKSKNWDVVNHAPIRIQDHAWLGFNVTVLKGVTIGTGAIIGANSVVTKDVPPWTVAAGNPARVIKSLIEPEK